MTHQALLNLLDRRKRRAGAWSKLAIELGVSAQYLHDCKERRRMPGSKLLDALGLEAVIDYAPKRESNVGQLEEA